MIKTFDIQAGLASRRFSAIVSGKRHNKNDVLNLCGSYVALWRGPEMSLERVVAVSEISSE